MANDQELELLFSYTDALMAKTNTLLAQEEATKEPQFETQAGAKIGSIKILNHV